MKRHRLNQDIEIRSDDLEELGNVWQKTSASDIGADISLESIDSVPRIARDAETSASRITAANRPRAMVLFSEVAKYGWSLKQTASWGQVVRGGDRKVLLNYQGITGRGLPVRATSHIKTLRDTAALYNKEVVHIVLGLDATERPLRRDTYGVIYHTNSYFSIVWVPVFSFPVLDSAGEAVSNPDENAIKNTLQSVRAAIHEHVTHVLFGKGLSAGPFSKNCNLARLGARLGVTICAAVPDAARDLFKRMMALSPTTTIFELLDKSSGSSRRHLVDRMWRRFLETRSYSWLGWCRV